LAMVSIIGMFFQDGLTGSAWGDWGLYTASPLRAFEGELGVQPPVGYWDPLGLALFDDPEVQLLQFQRRRLVEIQHGRVSMLATIGYIVPEYFKWPGLISPSQNLAFADIPNGLKAAAVIPFAGWVQIVGYVGYLEVSNLGKEPSGVPGDYGYGALGIPGGKKIEDPEVKFKKLSAELANGRLAMVSIIGMFFQDGLTGSAWGDWSNYASSPLRAFEEETGVQPPVGYWDPLGLAADGNMFEFKRRREVELKHGRISMFATIGYMVPEYYKFDGFLSPSYGVKFADVPNGLGALSKVPALGIFQIITFAGIVELQVYNDQVNDEPGNYGAGFLGLRSVGIMNLGIADPETRKRKLNAELANSRLAMVAIIGMFFQDGCTGSAWGDWANYTDSPLRAFESELGVQAPLGYWDPLGFSADGDLYSFKRRRSVEIKHGRICMLATMGYITPEITGKFPGYLSPSLGIKFEDIPNGLGAISKVGWEGWGQIIAYCFFCEFKAGYDRDVNSGKPGDMGWRPPLLATDDPDTKARRLNAELANGRLAMVAIIGMFFQDGLTGAAWGDWANYTDSPLR